MKKTPVNLEKKKPNRHLGIKKLNIKITCKITNSMDGPKSKIDRVKGRISKLENSTKEIAYWGTWVALPACDNCLSNK